MTDDGPPIHPASAAVDFLAPHLREMPLHRAILRSVEAKLMSRVSLTPPVLDLGAGDGHFASTAYARTIDAGLDLRYADLAVAARRPGTYRQVFVASGVALPFANHAFGTVVSNCVIEHIPDIHRAVSEIARVLKPGGAFATTLPSEHYAEFLWGSTVLRGMGLRNLARRYGHFFNRISYHHHVYPREEWRRLFTAVGLDMVEHTYYFSAAAHRAFDLCHYLSIPGLVAHTLTGRWVIHPAQVRPFEPWIRRFYDEPFPAVGAYQFIKCVKRAD